MNDPYIVCPYNKNHTVPRSRIQTHIMKCQEKHPELAICPYNATHRMKTEELKLHVKNCPTRLEMFSDIEKNKDATKGALRKPIPILQREYLPETDPDHEMWDD